MGILSAVSLAAPAGVLKTIFESERGMLRDIWNGGAVFVVLGSVFGILAAAYFYKQRSTLAWYYGQICLDEALGCGPSGATLKEWLRAADSWAAWWPYSWGVDALAMCCIGYVAAIATYLFGAHSSVVRTIGILFWIACVVAVALSALQRHVYLKYRFRESYWHAFIADIRKGRFRALPHDNVYSRLKPSPIAGVGVFAIRDITSGTYVFEPDDDALAPVEEGQVEALEPELRKLYEDFCVLTDGIYKCPRNFNRLTPSWFLNDSKQPNLAADLDLRFYALRDIKQGEELTSDYDTYSERN